MKATFDWRVNNNGFLFRCQKHGHLIGAHEWAKYDLLNRNGDTVQIGPILRMLEDETATEMEDKTVLAPHAAIALLTPGELYQLTLPQLAPFVLHIESHGLLSDPDFRFIYDFWHPDLFPVVNPQRTGCLIIVGGKDYILTEPYYSIVEIIDRFNTSPPHNTQEKFLALGMLKELLPDEVVLGDYLASINVVKADHFSLDAFLNDKGEPDFNPVLVRVVRRAENEVESSEGNDVERVLPNACQEFFAKHFRRSSKAKVQYAVGSGWFAVVSEQLCQALQVVKEYQGARAEVRRQFMANPRPFLREKLSRLYDEITIDNLFQESFEYGERVKEIGLWSPPVLPFFQKLSKEPWLPPEILGIRVGDEWVTIKQQDIESLRHQVIDAKQKGQPNIKYEGKVIPATQQTLDALNQLISVVAPVRADREPLPPTSSEKYVLIIKGNFEELEIQYQRGKRPGRSGDIPYDLLKTKLLPHQVQGLIWLQEHWVNGSPGALLADDMGLGKTLQALAFLAWVRKATEGPFLVVAPTGLLDEWAQQSEKHLNESTLGPLIKAYGRTLKELRKEGAACLKEIEGGGPVLNTNKLSEAGWVLATYETVRDYQHSFGQIKWRVVVFDEAQKIKNPSALMTCAAKALQTDFALALTGTPIENRPADIWCVVDTVRPGELGSLKDFSARYEKNGDLDQNSLKDLNNRLTEGTKPPILLRRQKSEYLKGLPEKKEHIFQELMPSIQSEAYNQVVAWAKNYGHKPGGILEALHKLRSVSLHPLDLEVSDLSPDEYIQASARLVSTFKILDEIANKNEKALIFLESIAMQGYLAELIQRRYGLKTPPMIINGTVSGPKRKKRVETFQSDAGFDVMIISPKAGGVGFTLTSANHVIHLSRWWNPAVEDQCTDRVYRISQDKVVHVYYPLAIHPLLKELSFDLRLHNLLNNKRVLYQRILAPPAGSTRDAEQLFKETVWGDQSEFLEKIDCMEPLAFEDWVLNKVKNAGYETKRTPVTGDFGADGIALARPDSGLPNLIIQIKHTQKDDLCSDLAVEQVFKAIKRYPQILPPILPVVVTNARGFSKSARKKAQQKKILLIDRKGLFIWPRQVTTNS